MRLGANGEAQIYIDGDLIVRDAADLKNKLLHVLHNYTAADIYLQNTSKIDVAGLQLLSALNKSAVMQNKSFRFFADGSAETLKLLDLSGYSHLFRNQ